MSNKFFQTIHGVEYEFEKTMNMILSEEIEKSIDCEGHEFTFQHEGTKSIIFFKSTLRPGPKNIGTLYCDLNDNVITFYKFGFASIKHEDHQDDCVALPWAVIKNLRPKDKILIEAPTNGGKNSFSMSVGKAMSFQSFRWHKNEGFEKQIFVPLSAFKKSFTKCTILKKTKGKK